MHDHYPSSTTPGHIDPQRRYMSVIRYLSLVSVALLALMTLSPAAHADNTHCWNLSPAHFSFGTVTAGESATSTNNLDFQCNNYSSTTVYVRMCLSLTSSNQLVMNTNPASTPLYYNLYSVNDPSVAIGGGNTTYAENTFAMSAQQNNTSFPMQLIAKIVPGQTRLSAGDYHDYNSSLTAKYAYSQTENSLPSCSAMTGETISDSITADADIKNGCELISVDPMNFGEKNPTGGSQLSGNARSSVVVRCPVNTNYTVTLGMGQHSDGGSRRMCNGNECVSYGLYQDAGNSVPWDDRSNSLTQTSTSGDEVSIPVYGNIPAQSWPAAGEYDDTVVVTLNY